MESDSNKIKIKLKLDKLNYKDSQYDKCKLPAKTNDESDVYKELESIKAVLEIREDELKKLRREIDRSKIKREVRQHKETQTEVDAMETLEDKNLNFCDTIENKCIGRTKEDFEWNLRGRFADP